MTISTILPQSLLQDEKEQALQLLTPDLMVLFRPSTAVHLRCRACFLSSSENKQAQGSHLARTTYLSRFREILKSAPLVGLDISCADHP